MPCGDDRREGQAEDREFAEAVEAYKHASGRMFPTWGEILEVLRGLGYRRPSAADPVAEDLRPEGPRYSIIVASERDEATVDRMTAAIAALGGRRDPLAPGVFAFASGSARDAALDAVRHAFGQTAALPIS